MNVKQYIFLCLLLTGIAVQAQTNKVGHEIQVQIQGISDTSLILAHRFGDKFYTDDTIRLDQNGRGVFAGPKELDPGMYQLVLPDKSFFDFFIDQNQNFSIQSKAGQLLEHSKAIGESMNQLFFEWQRAHLNLRNTPAMKEVWDTTLLAAGLSLVGKFLTSLRPFEIPEQLLNKEGFKDNQLAQYHYYKDHFFDQTDLSDSRLLKTPVILNKLSQFFTKVAPPHPDSLALYCDWVLAKAAPSPEVFQYTLQFLLNHFSEPQLMGTDAVYVHLAEKYYLNGRADWIDADNLKQITNRVNELKPLLIGRLAPRIKGLQTPDNKPVDPFEENHKWSVLYFWEPNCGHCKKATPELFALYPYIKSIGGEVYAINTRLDLIAWNDFIAEHELSWVNLYSPDHTREILENYQAWTTPLVYILDSKKQIIAKDLAVSQVKEYMEYLNSSEN